MTFYDYLRQKKQIFVSQWRLLDFIIIKYIHFGLYKLLAVNEIENFDQNELHVLRVVFTI